MLNEIAHSLCEHAEKELAQLGISLQRLSCGSRIFDCGVHSPGSLDAGVLLARICLADLATVVVRPAQPWPLVQVQTDHPVAACMASQYAGWEIKGENYFAMGSGPMRASAAREELFKQIGFEERPGHCVGVLESSQLPPEDVCLDIAAKCRIKPQHLTLFVAPTSSIAGTLQVVARSLEAVLHKLHELEFDLYRVARGLGTAPLPPLANNDFAAIGRTNDAILYGGDVSLSIKGDDSSLAEIGPRLPSAASADYGTPFAEVLAKYNNNFYEVDPLLFSSAKIQLSSIDTGNTHEFGQLNHDILLKSFADQ